MDKSSHFSPPNGLRWLYVDFNSYFASVEQQMNPALRGKPVAVVPVETDSTCAIAASYEAKAYGVKTGTPIYEARKMCPGLICVLGRHQHYVAYHDRLVKEVDRHIQVTAVCSIDEMACRLMKNEYAPVRAIEIAHHADLDVIFSAAGRAAQRADGAGLFYGGAARCRNSASV